jgi:hypothetical protein
MLNGYFFYKGLDNAVFKNNIRYLLLSNIPNKRSE